MKYWVKMRIDGIQITEGGAISNLSVKTGTAFPSSPNAGELFFRTDTLTTTKGLYVYSGTAWTRIQSELQLVSPIVATLPTDFIQGTSVYLNSGDSNEGFYIYDSVSGWIGVSKPTQITGDVTGTISPGISSSLTLNTITNSNTGSLLKFTSNTKGLITGTTPVVTADLTSLLNTTYASLTGSNFTGPIITGSGLYDTSSNFTRIVNPGNASFESNSASTAGAIKIKLPQNNSSTMMMFEVKIFNYSSLNGQGTSRTFQIGGYNFSGGGWINYFANELSSTTITPLNVRFGFDSTTDCIWIGELSTTWSYVKVAITQFQGGFSNTPAAWSSGWQISLVTAYDTVEQTISASLCLNNNNFSSYALPLTGGTLTGNTSLNISSTGATTFSIINNNSATTADARINLSNGTNTGGLLIRGSGFTSIPNRVTLYSSAGSGSEVSINTNGVDRVVINSTSVTSSIPFVGTLTGNASTATTLQTGRTFSLTGDVTGTSAAFDGSAAASIPVTLANSGATAGTYGSNGGIPVVTVNTKGLITSVSTTPLSMLNNLTTTDANNDNGVGLRGMVWSTGSLNFPTVAGVGLEVRRASGTVSDSGTFQIATSNDTTSNLWFRKVTGYSAGDTWTGWNQVLYSGFPYIQATGRSSSYGSTNGVSTGGLNVIMGTSTSATWLVSGTSAGTFRGGIQLLDAGGAMRLYSGTSTYLEINGNNVNMIAGSTLTAPTVIGSLTGNASTATALQTGRTFSLTGDATGTSAAFDGSAAASIPVTLVASGATAGTYGDSTNIPVVTLNAKGIVTSVSTVGVANPATVAYAWGSQPAANSVATGTEVVITGLPSGVNPATGIRTKWYSNGTYWYPYSEVQLHSRIAVIGTAQTAEQVLLAIPIPAGVVPIGYRVRIQLTVGRTGNTTAWGNLGVRIGNAGTLSDGLLTTKDLSTTFTAGGATNFLGLDIWLQLTSATSWNLLGSPILGQHFTGDPSTASSLPSVSVGSSSITTQTYISITATMGGTVTAPQLWYTCASVVP